MSLDDADYTALEPAVPLARDLSLLQWRASLQRLSATRVRVRPAIAGPPDARRMKDLQVVSEPITVRSVRDNATMIENVSVLLAEVGETHVGFCASLTDPNSSGPLFVQVVAVAPNVRRLGVGLALLTAAAEREPHRDVALATQDSNEGAHALNAKFALAIDASIRRVPLGTFPDRHLGIQRGLGYRSWVLERRSRLT